MCSGLIGDPTNGQQQDDPYLERLTPKAQEVGGYDLVIS